MAAAAGTVRAGLVTVLGSHAGTGVGDTAHPETTATGRPSSTSRAETTHARRSLRAGACTTSPSAAPTTGVAEGDPDAPWGARAGEPDGRPRPRRRNRPRSRSRTPTTMAASDPAYALSMVVPTLIVSGPPLPTGPT